MSLCIHASDQLQLLAGKYKFHYESIIGHFNDCNVAQLKAGLHLC